MSVFRANGLNKISSSSASHLPHRTPLHPQDLILYFYVCMSPHIIKMDIKSKLFGVFVSKCKIHFVFDDLEISTPYIMPLNNYIFKMKSSFIFVLFKYFFFFSSFFFTVYHCNVLLFFNVNHKKSFYAIHTDIYMYTHA